MKDTYELTYEEKQQNKWVNTMKNNEPLNNFHKVNSKILLDLYDVKGKYERLLLIKEVLQNCVNQRQYKANIVVKQIADWACSKYVKFILSFLKEQFFLYDGWFKRYGEYNPNRYQNNKEEETRLRTERDMLKEDDIINLSKKCLELLLSNHIAITDKINKKKIGIFKKTFNEMEKDFVKHLEKFNFEEDKDLCYLFDTTPEEMREAKKIDKIIDEERTKKYG
jgi:hypothetical protein